MKSVLINGSLFLFLTLICQAQEDESSKIEKAENAYVKSVEASRVAYRKALSAAISDASSIEIMLLGPASDANQHSTALDSIDPFGNADKARTFPIRPYKISAAILKRKVLTAGEIASLMPELQSTITALDGNVMAACHDPIHAVRVYIGENVVFETSICYHCNNFYMTYPFDDAHWECLSNPKFQAIMEKLMPFPKAQEPTSAAKKRGGEKPKKQ